MTGQFNFNFSGDDIGEDDDAETSTSHTPVAEVAGPTPELVEARSVSLESLVGRSVQRSSLCLFVSLYLYIDEIS
jgi:hypothetical protein